jgi:beta-lactamase superfamily II metal-dependent hydrolase
MAPETGGATIDFGALRLTVVGPRQAEIEALRIEWAKQLKEKEKKRGKKAGVAALDIDTTPTNLSSIVCLAEFAKKRMLLTGDARADKILDGLEAAKILRKGEKLDLDLVKVPHHGSSRNLTEKFFDRLRTPEFVISADGEHDNPDIESLKMLSRVRTDDQFTINMTYGKLKHVDAQVHEFFAVEKAAGRDYTVKFRPADAISLRVDLLEQRPPA